MEKDVHEVEMEWEYLTPVNETGSEGSCDVKEVVQF